MYDIDSKLLVKAIEYYSSKGFLHLSAPMLVDKDIIELTLPKDKSPREHSNTGLYYVGSAEQSYYQLLKKHPSIYSKNSYMLLTPCERDEVEDELHLGIFLKLELISCEITSYGLASLVYEFLHPYILSKRCTSALVKTDEGYDIEINNIEVGSFGTRSVFGKDVTYGTGLALPRISQALSKTL